VGFQAPVSPGNGANPCLSGSTVRPGGAGNGTLLRGRTAGRERGVARAGADPPLPSPANFLPSRGGIVRSGSFIGKGNHGLSPSRCPLLQEEGGVWLVGHPFRVVSVGGEDTPDRQGQSLSPYLSEDHEGGIPGDSPASVSSVHPLRNHRPPAFRGNRGEVLGSWSVPSQALPFPMEALRKPPFTPLFSMNPLLPGPISANRHFRSGIFSFRAGYDLRLRRKRPHKPYDAIY